MAAQPESNSGFLPHTASAPLPSLTTNVPGPGDSTWLVASDAGRGDSRRMNDRPPVARTLTVYPRVFGEYQLLDELGSGGMGVVYKARQEGLNRTVALKMVRSGFLASERELQRFQNEAEAIALLDHTNIVPIYEVGQCGGQRYFSMKLITGGSLSSQLDDFRTCPRAIARLIITIAHAVHHAHLRGILHCDLKPANILIDEDGRPHVTDFGLAKRVDLEASLTGTNSIMGTPPYMAPEQAAGQRTNFTTATDVYGLGAVLYALLTGRAPFVEQSVLETLNQVRERNPDLPSKYNPDVPQDLETICLKCLEKDPQRRYESAQDLADDLERWLAREPIVARPVGSAVRLWMWCKRKPAYAGLVASLVIVVIVGFAGMGTLWQQAKTQRDEKELQRLAAVKAQAEAERSAEQLRVAFDEIDQRRAAELELREHAYDLEGELESVELEIARLGNERTRTKSQLQQRSELIQKLRKQLNEVTAESTKISELETELARSVSEMDQIQQENEKIVGQLDLRASEVTRLREKLSTAESEKRRIRQQLDAQFRRSRGQPARKTSAKPNSPNASLNPSPTKKR